jgi:nucleoside-diphosphate-sugar epimerase
LQAKLNVETQVYNVGGSPLRGNFDVVVLAAPPSEDCPTDEEKFASELAAGVRLIYLSTTGVYAKGTGQPVRDDYLLAPFSQRGQRRLQVERALRRAHANTICLRVPSIYGPGRGVHKRLLAGNYRLIGPANTLVSRIHVDDLVDAIVLLGELEEVSNRDYVIGDELPTTSLEHAQGVATRLGLELPPIVNPDTVSPGVVAMLGANRGILPERLQALGWQPKHATWREGLEQILATSASTAKAE